jgi:uncharacterized membrane protein YhhN
MEIAALATAVLALAFLAVELGERASLRWATKPFASASFVACAIAAGALSSTYGRAIAAALSLSFVGDVLLIPRGKTSFLAGLACFLAAHVAFAIAFFVRGVDGTVLIAAAAVISPISFFISRRLLPHVEAKMRAPVIAYALAISAMVAAAAGTVAAEGGRLIAVAAIAFYLSDLSVARDRFVAPGVVNRVWGVPLYYGAQVLFALSVAN